MIEEEARFFNDVSQAVETILAEPKEEQLLRPLYKNINPNEGFGVERFVLDRVYYLPQLLENTQLTFLSGMTYLVSSEQKDASGNAIRLEHRFQATNEEEAKKLYEKISAKLAGVHQKIWLACWRLGNQLKKFTYTCALTDLMKLTYPDRDGYFSMAERIDFYEHLRSLEQTRFVFSKPYMKGSKELMLSYFIPLLNISQQLGKERYPQHITLSIRALVPYPANEKIVNVAAEIKHRTLELHADDTQLATWIQARKGQRPQEECIEIDLDYLLKLAGLERTALSNKTAAKKLLRKKLQRYVEKGILRAFPEKIKKMLY